MDEWTQILQRLWWYLEHGPQSSPITSAIAVGNRYKFDLDDRDVSTPANVMQPVLIVDQLGGVIDSGYTTANVLITEQFELALWTDTLQLSTVNDLRRKALAALMCGYPDMGLSFVEDVSFRSGTMTMALDKRELDADNRLLRFRRDLRTSRRRAALLEIAVRFTIDKHDLITT